MEFNALALDSSPSSRAANKCRGVTRKEVTSFSASTRQITPAAVYRYGYVTSTCQEPRQQRCHHIFCPTTQAGVSSLLLTQNHLLSSLLLHDFPPFRPQPVQPVSYLAYPSLSPLYRGDWLAGWPLLRLSCSLGNVDGLCVIISRNQLDLDLSIFMAPLVAMPQSTTSSPTTTTSAVKTLICRVCQKGFSKAEHLRVTCP